MPGPDGEKKAYSGRLKAALAEALPQTKVEIATDVKPRRTAEAMAQAFGPLRLKHGPSL